MKLKRKNKLIPRFSLPAYHRKKVDNITQSSPFANKNKEWQFFTEEALYCTLQTLTKADISVDLTGLSSEDMFILRTKTPMYEAEEGTGFIGSGVYIPDSYYLDPTMSSIIEVPSKGGWFNVVSSKYWGNGIFPHYECIIIKDNKPTIGEYPSDVVTLCESYFETKNGLLSGGWVEQWLQNYTVWLLNGDTLQTNGLNIISGGD